MAGSLALFRFVAKAALNAVGCGIPIGDFAVEALPDIARDIWGRWGKDRKPAELRDEVQAVAALPAAGARQQAAEVVAQEAGNQPETVRQALTAYLVQLPNAIRQSQRRVADPSGRSVSPHLSLCRAEDLIPLLPPRSPRFKVGDRPLPAVDWELEELLGMGGFGEVWKARNPHLPQPVALKFCLDPQAAKVLGNEAALLGRVMSQGQHPRIVRLLHTYLSANPPCLEYEYVAGGDLTGLVYEQLQKNQGKLPPDLVVKVVRSLARAMRHPHHLTPPIVHRDLKPANILVQRGAEGFVTFRITDFGIGGVVASQAIEQARGASTGHFLATALRGAHTPLYASPQQMEGADPDPRDDVYALGVIWYQMLVGDLSKGAPHGIGWRRPFLEQGVPEPILNLLQSCFEDDPACRPSDAGALAEQIEALLGQPPAAITKQDDKRPEDQKPEGQKPDQPEPGDKKPGEVPPQVVPTDPLAEAAAALGRGDYSAAIAACKQALKANPPPLRAYRLRARAYAGKNKLDQAIKDFNIVVASPEATCADFVERGRLLVRKGKANKAVLDFTQAITHNPKLVSAYLDRARAYVASGALDLAFADFEAALKIAPQNASVFNQRGEVFLARGEHEQALAEFDKAVQFEPNDACGYIGRGRVHLALGRPQQALGEFMQAAQANPKCAEAFLYRGITYGNLGQDEQAAADLTRALTLDPKSAEALAARARVRARLGQHGWALSDFDKVIKLRPRDAALRLDRGRSQQAKGDLDAAIADFQAAIRLDQTSAAAYQARGEAYLWARKFGRAVSDLTRALELNPAGTDAVVARAWAYLLKGQYDEAIADATEAIRVGQKPADAYQARGCAHLEKKALDQALADLTESLRLDPQNASCYNNRGRAYHLSGDYDRAVADFTLAIKLNGKNPDYYQNRARSYAKKGDKEKAQTDREKATSFAAS
jgi:tetratricopeptide (TPR) repeat protein